MSKKYVVMLELDVFDETNPRKWEWGDLIDTSRKDVIVKSFEVLEIKEDDEDYIKKVLDEEYEDER
jgi:hypothetical protein